MVARRRDRTHALEARRDAAPSAGVGARGAGAPGPRSADRRLFPEDEVGRRGRRGGGGPDRRVGSPVGDLRGSVPRALDRLPPRRPLDQPSPAQRGWHPAFAGPGAAAPEDRAAHLAVLRAIPGTRVASPSGRQFPGDPAARDRSPHVAHERRPGVALDGRSERPRVDRNGRDAGSAGGDVEHPPGPGALPRPLLQLVRHESPRSAGASVRVHRRQRQSRGAPDRASARVPRAARRARPDRTGAQRHRRHARPSAGGLDRSRRPKPGEGRDAPSPRAGSERRGGALHPRAGLARGVEGTPRRPGRAGRDPDGRGPRPPAGGPVRGRGGGPVGPVPPGLRGEPRARRRRRRKVGRSVGNLRPPALRDRIDGRTSLGGDGFHVPVRPVPRALRDRVPPLGRSAGQRALRPSGLGGAADEFPRDRARVGARRALVPSRETVDTRRARLGFALLVGIHVRVPDGGSRARSALRQPAGSDESPRRAATDPIRAGARRSLGNLRVRLQRPGRPLHLSVLELRRQRAGTEARPRRRPGGGALRHRTGGHGRPGRGPGEPREDGRPRRPRGLRVLRVDRLHAHAAARGRSPSRSCRPTWRITRA